MAINFLVLQDSTPHASFLKTSRLSGKSMPIKLAAIRTLSAIPGETIAEFTMENWQNLDPAVQDGA